MNSLCELLQAGALRRPDNVLVHHRGHDWTYSSIWDRAASLAAWLRRHGLRQGQRVGLLLPNCAEYIVAYFGILLADGVVVALNPDTTAGQLSGTLAHCRPSAVITAKACEKHLQAIASQLQDVRIVIRLSDEEATPIAFGKHAASFSQALDHNPIEWSAQHASPARTAQIVYTSGTTGRPKGVTLSHRSLLANCESILAYLELASSDSALVVLPFFYSYGNSVLLTHVAVGGRLVIAGDVVFWNRVLDLMQQQKVTGLSGVPATYAVLLSRSAFSSREFPFLRYLTCAGGALAPALAEKVRRVAPDAKLFLMYGQTEAAARLSTLMPEDLDAKPGSIGKGIPGVELSVLDEAGGPVALAEVGEIVARGENLMDGYWNDSEATRRALRPEGLHTGDLARVDEDGYIYIVGRRSDMIKSNSHRISPYEIEEVLLEIEGVGEAAVVGQRDAVQGEILVAFIVPATPGNAPSEQTVLAHCRSVLPRHKHVRHVHVADSLPRTSSSKIRRGELRDRLHASYATHKE